MLRASGTSLIEGLGKAIRLTGYGTGANDRRKIAGTNNPALPGDITWFWSDDVHRLANAGGNCIEIRQIRLGSVMPQRGVINESFFTDWLDMWASWCEQNGVYYIINIMGLAIYQTSLTAWGPRMPYWVWEGYGRPTTVDEQAIIVHDFWDTAALGQGGFMPANRQAFIDAWAFIANRYKNHKYALFGIINEPFAHTVPQMSDTRATYFGGQYKIMMEAVIDAIRATGAQQVVFLDLPYVKTLSNVQPVNRPNIAWEDHYYVTGTKDINVWKQNINNSINRFVNDFGKPLYIGEYGIDPRSLYTGAYISTWPDIISEQVQYLNESPVCGRNFHELGIFTGEQIDFNEGPYFTPEQSDWLFNLISSPMPTPTPTFPLGPVILIGGVLWAMTRGSNRRG